MGKRAWQLWTMVVLCLAAAAFIAPALVRTGGVWPAPLDDVYIYHGHARAAALGAPMSWFPGNGYSSGATSPLYPLLLAPAWWLGLRGPWIGVAALGLAIVALYDLCRSLALVMRERRARWLIAPLLVSVPLLDWSWWSGMETALFAAFVGRALRAADAALTSVPTQRARRQLATGCWLALMVTARPESVVLALALALAVVHGARSLGTLSSLARSVLPLALLLALQATANRALTGEWAQAGAVRKLVWNQPDGEVVTVVRHLVVLIHQALARALGAEFGLALLALLLAAIVSRRQRRLALALLVGAVGSLLLACLNVTAPYQNYRYAAPLLLMLLCAAALGMSALMRRRWVAGAALAIAAIAAPSGELERQVNHFARASANIVEQHGEVARRLDDMVPRPRRVLLNDAGAIPYLSGIAPLDGLGLGGFRGMPFARASVQGVAAVVELIERLPPDERPDVMAIYPAWWGEVATRFGRRIDAVRIVDNVICAADEKVIYAADWSLLDADTGGIDIGDLLDERAHGVEAPGAIVSHVLNDGEVLRWDAGRSGSLSFVADRAADAVAVRIDADSHGTLSIGGVSVALAQAGDGRWREVVVRAPIARGARVAISAPATVALHHIYLR